MQGDGSPIEPPGSDVVERKQLRTARRPAHTIFHLSATARFSPRPQGRGVAMIARVILLLGAVQLSWLGGPATSLGRPPGHGLGTNCVLDTIGLNPEIWNTGRGTFFGRALGQTFRTVDTVITRLTVWRPPGDVDGVGTRLFVTAVDTTQGGRPSTGAILRNGPTVFIRDSDPPGQLIRMDFVFEPPMTLPGPGFYAFFLQREGCDAGETRIVASTNNPYPHGIYWITGRTVFLPCLLRSADAGEDYTDLIFEIESCATDVTPVRATTWGELKLRYR